MAKHFDCPHCDTPVGASEDDLHAAAAALTCPGCHKVVYLSMGRLSNYQPGDQPEGYRASYDSGD